MSLNRRIRALSLAALLPAMAAGQAHASGWHATATHATDLQEADARDNGLLPDSAPMHITVSLALHNRAQLDDFIRRAGTPGDASYGHFLSGAEFVSRYSPTAREAAAVVTHLQKHGFTNISVAPNRLLVTADGTVRGVRGAFNTEVHQFDIDGRHAFANTRDAQVPEHLKGTVLAVLGLQNVAEIHTMLSQVGSNSVGPNAYNPTAFPQAYDAGTTATAAQTNVAIIAMGSVKQTVTDLATFETNNNLPKLNVIQVPVDGSSNIEAGTDEWNLDSQSIQGVAGGSVKNLYFYMANPTKVTGFGIGFLSDTFNQAVTDNVAKVINASLGGCESMAHSQGVTATDDQIFAQGASQGQTFVIAAGDGGSNTGCFAHHGLFKMVSYPASSPYVVSVGGTTLTTTGAGTGTYVSETAWVDGGGGISSYEAMPTWQSGLVSGTKRSVPDVAYDADPNSGANIVLRGNLLTVGGTSLSAPLFTGTFARAQTTYSNKLGFAAPLIYSLASRVPSAFHDVTTGNNGSYSAQAGFDQTTGFGSPDISVFVKHVNGN